MNIYETTFTVKCPNDDDEIEYTLNIKTGDVIMVEKINNIIGILPEILEHTYQESIADALLNKFGGKQTMTAVHQGVEIKTVRGAFGNPKRLGESIRAAFFRNGFSDWEVIADQVIEEMK